MKNLKKKLRKRTVEAYACNCKTPNDCIIVCAGDILRLNDGAQEMANTIGPNLA